MEGGFKQYFMRVLYLKHDLGANTLKIYLLNFYNNLLCFNGVNAFFEPALWSAFKVKSITTKKALKNKEWVDKNFDLIVVNYKTDIGRIETRAGKDRTEKIIEISKAFKKPKGLFLNTARASFMPPEEVLDSYDLIFKREIFKDLNKYNISEENKKKICTTMISCPFIKIPKYKFLSPFFRFFYPRYKRNKKHKHDIFFCGSKVKKERNEEDRVNIWQRIKKEKFNSLGGIVYKRSKDKNIPEELLCEEFKGRKYIKAINSSKICLATEGIGEFTFRHLELWCLGAFVLSNNSINKLDLPIKPIDGVHYVSFDNIDDMIEKIKYYLKHDEEREKIAQAGRKMFEEQYDVVKHGIYIKNNVINKLNGK